MLSAKYGKIMLELKTCGMSEGCQNNKEVIVLTELNYCFVCFKTLKEYVVEFWYNVTYLLQPVMAVVSLINSYNV